MRKLKSYLKGTVLGCSMTMLTLSGVVTAGEIASVEDAELHYGTILRVMENDIVINDMNYSFVETTEYIGVAGEGERRSRFIAGRDVQFVIDAEDNLLKIVLVAETVGEDIAVAKDEKQPSNGPSIRNDEVYMENGVLKN